MNKKKVCFISQFPPPIHGLSKAVDTLYNSNLNEEFEFYKIDIKNNRMFIKHLYYIIKAKADIFYFTISQSKGGNIRDLIIMKLLNMKKANILIHLHGGYYRELIENYLPIWQRRLNYKAISQLSGVIVLSDLLKSNFKGMICDSKINIVENCIDDEFLMDDDAFEIKTAKVNQKPIKRVLYLSNFIRSKGYYETLKMAVKEKNRCLNGGVRKLHFDFAGKFFEETEKKFFWNFVKENKLEDYITFHGLVSGSKKMELLSKCNIFSLITTYKNEGQPISILEAMGNGMIIITTNHAGIADIVKDKVNGLVIDKDAIDSDLVYYTLLDLVDQNELYKTIAMNNRELIKLKFNEQAYIEKMKMCFTKCNSFQ